jgi:hypothetical protein
MAELSEDAHERIQALCKKGDVLAKKGSYAAALQQYWAAWDLLPEPQTDWEAATWILAAVGDANFLGGDFTAGRDNLSMAMHCPDTSATCSCTCGWARMNWPARTWGRGPTSSTARASTSRSSRAGFRPRRMAGSPSH